MIVGIFFCIVLDLQYLLIRYAALDNKNKSGFILYCPRFAVPLHPIKAKALIINYKFLIIN